MKLNDVIKAAIVDVIRGLWDRGLYRKNEWLKLIHENWFSFWVEWKVGITMLEVDEQVEELLDEWGWTDEDDIIKVFDDWVYTESSEGETPLGGEMRVRAPFVDQEEP